MVRSELTVDWRAKVNPLFVLAIQFLRLIPRLVRKLAHDRPGDGAQLRTVLVEACEETILLLPVGLPEKSEVTEDLIGHLTSKGENKWLADPEVRRAVADVAARVESTPESLLRKGFERPHWWMTENSWLEFLQKEHIAEDLLNAVALLQLKTPLHDLTQRVANGDAGLYTKLFRSENKGLRDGIVGLQESVLRSLTDQATRIVGRALLLKGDPPGYQLRLRMTLFFGWDFGLRDLSIPELRAFLSQVQVIPNWYDSETLRKYRDRLRSFINRVSRRSLPEATGPGISKLRM